jgi:hypothetical protein
VYIL